MRNFTLDDINTMVLNKRGFVWNSKRIDNSGREVETHIEDFDKKYVTLAGDNYNILTVWVNNDQFRVLIPIKGVKEELDYSDDRKQLLSIKQEEQENIL